MLTAKLTKKLSIASIDIAAMLSPGSERPSIRELFHGIEEGNIIPAENAKFNALKNDTPDRIQHQSSSPPAPTREQTSGPFVNSSATSPARAAVSVEPLRFSPSQDAVQSPDIANYSKTAFVRFKLIRF